MTYPCPMSGPRASQCDVICLRKGHLDPSNPARPTTTHNRATREKPGFWVKTGKNPGLKTRDFPSHGGPGNSPGIPQSRRSWVYTGLGAARRPAIRYPLSTLRQLDSLAVRLCNRLWWVFCRFPLPDRRSRSFGFVHFGSGNSSSSRSFEYLVGNFWPYANNKKFGTTRMGVCYSLSS